MQNSTNPLILTEKALFQYVPWSELVLIIGYHRSHLFPTSGADAQVLQPRAVQATRLHHGAGPMPSWHQLRRGPQWVSGFSIRSWSTRVDGWLLIAGCWIFVIWCLLVICNLVFVGYLIFVVCWFSIVAAIVIKREGDSPRKTTQLHLGAGPMPSWH